jgi:hypothetical protein
MSKTEQKSITSIDRADRRDELKPRRAPHWKRIAEGRYIGFRYMTRGSAGTWLARAWLDAEKKYVYEQLGDFAEKLPGERYDAALAAAEIWFNHLRLGGSAEDVTVKMASESYIAKLRAERGERVARSAEGFIRRQVYVDPIASILLSKLNKAHCAAWRERILKRVAGV